MRVTRVVAAVAWITSAGSLRAQVDTRWPQHSLERPQPPVVTPGPFVREAPPSDAIVLFDGTSLAAWQSADSAGGPAKWKVASGYVEVVPGTSSIRTKQSFGDVQLHVEWRTPTPPTGESQERGNSGVFLMGRYELQVLDSYHNVTYSDGHAGAIFGQFPPLVNASRPSGEWQSYDVVFHRPRWNADGRLAAPARFTVFWNGILVQDDVALSGPTAYQRRPPYEKHADALPITLQNHGDPVRFRNVWVRQLER